MKQTLHAKTLLIIGLLFFNVFAIAQVPSNDNCMDAYVLEIAPNEASCNMVAATTVNASASDQPPSVCSGTSFSDDVWFSFTTPMPVLEGSIVIRCYFDEPFVDVPSVGMAIYEGCGWGAQPIDCFTTADPERNQIVLFSSSLEPDQTYYVRVWSTPGMNENSGTFRICAFNQAPSDDVVLWGDLPGEGDFDGGMNGWTTVAVSPDDDAEWRWTGCACSAGELDHSILTSPTSFNGAMIFDADSLNCCINDDPPPSIFQQTGELWSPIIDCSDFPSVAVKFYQSYAALTSTTSLSYSIDGGTTWLDTIEVNKEFVPNQKSYSPSFIKVPILEAAGESDVRIKFIFSGNFYNWIIDDVQLVLHENNNLRLFENSIAIAPNAKWPISQLECFGFRGDIVNEGAAPQPNTNFNIRIVEDASSNEVYNDTENLGTIAPLDSIKNQIIDGCFTPENQIKSYYATYTVSSDSTDAQPDTNLAGFGFETTEFLFAKENGGTQAIGPNFLDWEIDEPHSWAYGNFYHIVKGSEDDPKVFARSGTFAIGNADDNNVAGKVVSLYLYKWVEDSNNDGNMDFDERTKVAYAHYNIQGTETPLDLITLPLISYPDGDPVDPELIILDSNQDYVLMLEYDTETFVDVEFVASDAFDYSAQIALSELNGLPRYAGMLGVNGELDSIAYNSVGFGRNIVPVVRLTLSDEITNTEDLPFDDFLLTLSPNPVRHTLNLHVNLQQKIPEATIKIFDLNGKLLIEKGYQNIQYENLSFDVNNFSSGTYFLQFISNQTVKTEKFIVHR